MSEAQRAHWMKQMPWQMPGEGYDAYMTRLDTWFEALWLEAKKEGYATGAADENEELRSQVTRLTRKRDDLLRELGKCLTPTGEAELERLREQVRWIPVEERLPKGGVCPEEVLFSTRTGEVYLGAWRNDHWRDAIQRFEPSAVTCWIPKPKPTARAALESTTREE